jgi:hypothetical protein
VLTVSKTKSSTRFPSTDNACARTPLGPLKTKKENIFFEEYFFFIITTVQHR